MTKTAAAPPAGARATALAAQKAGRRQEAFAAWRAHLADAPGDAGAWSNLGALLRSMGEPGAAALHHRRAAELRPGDPEILANLANALADADRPEEALEARRRALALRPQDARAAAALVAALTDGTLGGAGLDVFEDEPNVPEALFGMENVTLLPHVGSATVETRKGMGRLMRDNLSAHFEGRPLLTPVI